MLNEESAQISQRAAEAAERRAAAAERRADAIEELVRQLTMHSGGGYETRRRPGRPGGRPGDIVPPMGSTPPEDQDVSWDVEHVGKSLFRLRNTGTVTATGVRMDRARMNRIVRNVPEDAVVLPGEATEFMMAATAGSRIPAQVWVTWEGQDEPVAVPVPAV